MPLECLATIRRRSLSQEYGLSASCKTERVNVARDIWTQPNADMCAITGANEFMVVSRYDRTPKGVMLHPASLGEKPDRQYVDPAAAFDQTSLDIRRCQAERLESLSRTIDIFESERPVTARTVYALGEDEVTIEYPLKTVNFSRRDGYYQVDTGPVLFLGQPTGPHRIERLHLAYIAHCGGDWAEFIVSQPTPLDNSLVSVHHFSTSHRVQAQHSLWLVHP